MEIKDTIIQELRHEAAGTVKMLERLTENHIDWRPHEKSMTLKSLAFHIADLQVWFNNALKGTSYDFFDKPSKISADSFKELSEKVAKGVEDNIAFIQQTDNQFWNEMFTFQAGDHIVMTVPRIVAYRTMLMNHLIHHRGQLSTYLRALDIPVPGMYGPSADEK